MQYLSHFIYDHHLIRYVTDIEFNLFDDDDDNNNNNNNNNYYYYYYYKAGLLKPLHERKYLSECSSQQSVLTANPAVTLIIVSHLTLRSSYRGALQSLIMMLICFSSDPHWFGFTDPPVSSRATVSGIC
jgi:hypothetical protein